MAESREELVLALERAREKERDEIRIARARVSVPSGPACLSAHPQYIAARDAMYAAQDRLQQWDEEHYGEDS